MGLKKIIRFILRKQKFPHSKNWTIRPTDKICVLGPHPDDETIGCVVGFEILERIGRKRGFLISGGEINTERAANTVLDEYRSGKIGRMTLEAPKQ